MPTPKPAVPDSRQLSKYCTWRDALDLYDGDEDAFIAAYATQALPADVCRMIEETMGLALLQTWLLRLLIRHQVAHDRHQALQHDALMTLLSTPAEPDR